MDISAELRYPTKWYSKLVVAVIAIVFFTFLSTTGISVFLLYRILAPTRSQMELSATDFPGRPEEFKFTVPGGAERAGWFFPGLRGAPTIILCHGYGSSRGELLTLATSLQDRQYNVFMFDFIGHGENKGYSTMGYVEARELKAALEALAKRDDVDAAKFGVWGTNIGAYAALAVAEQSPTIRAVVVESVYDQPSDFMKIQIDHSGLAGIPFLKDMTVRAFAWKMKEHKDLPPLSAHLSRTAGVFKLFLESPDEPKLAQMTRDLYLKAPEPKQDAVLGQGNYAGMQDDAKKLYENRVLSFFLVYLPATSSR
ncbi:MAG: alpha/beta fold hydrolase [Candidatus Acidiferrales bacterium]